MIQYFPVFLKVLAIGIFAVSAGHLVFGPQADLMLGAALGEAVVGDPVLDSQNRRQRYLAEFS